MAHGVLGCQTLSSAQTDHLQVHPALSGQSYPEGPGVAGQCKPLGNLFLRDDYVCFKVCKTMYYSGNLTGCFCRDPLRRSIHHQAPRRHPRE